MFKLLILEVTCLALSVAAADADHIVETSYGKVKGQENESRDGRRYHEFLGIPYAKAERFQPPTPPNTWTDVRDATKFGSPCFQVKFDIPGGKNPSVIGSEDCLNLNVYTPKIPHDDQHKVLLPVMVFFAGGFFHGTGNAYGAKYIMDTDAVLVTFNSRLGAFGFLNTGDEYARGNQGLKDQVALLIWVQKNIEKFGGDKDRVTIFGQGQGAACVHYHILSPMSKGLFHNAISQSGAATAPWAFTREPIRQTKLFAEKVGCSQDRREDLITCLAQKKPEELVLTEFGDFLSEFKHREPILLGPSIERGNENNAFLTASPHKLQTEGHVNAVPWLVGANNLAGAHPLTIRIARDPKQLQLLNDEFNQIIPNVLLFNRTATNGEDVAKKIREFYFSDKTVNTETRNRLFGIVSQRMFFAPGLKSARIHSKSSPVFVYFLSKISDQSMFDIFGLNEKPGSALFDELHYQFPIPTYNFNEITKDSPEYEFSKNLVQLWTSFSETGKPSRTWGDAKVWAPFDVNKVPVTLYSIDTNTGDYAIDTPKSTFWMTLYGDELRAEFEEPPVESF